MSPGLVRGSSGTGGITSSSGSSFLLRSTSSSPVEKPVTVRSMSRSSEDSSASSTFRMSKSHPAPSAILLSARRKARFWASFRPYELDRRHLRHPDRLCREQTAVSRDEDAFRIDQDGVREAELPDRGHDLLELAFRVRACIARVGLEASRCPVGHCQAMKDRHGVEVSEQNGNVYT